MKISFIENGKVTISLTGKLNADNAAQVGEELMKEIKNISPDELFLDFSALEYISSMGLREMLKVKKENPDIPITITEANETVYEIFETTGFADYFMVYKAGEKPGSKANHRFGRKLNGVSVKHGYFE